MADDDIELSGFQRRNIERARLATMEQIAKAAEVIRQSGLGDPGDAALVMRVTQILATNYLAVVQAAVTR